MALPELDLFHQLVYKSPEGFTAIRVCDDNGVFPTVHIYTPQGERFGGTGAVNEASVMSDIRDIIKWRIEWEKSRII